MFARFLPILLTAAFAVSVANAQSSVPVVGSSVDALPRMGLSSNVNYGASVSGIIVNLRGRPVRNAEVQLKEILNGNSVASAVSAVNGSFQFTNVPPGEYDVVATMGVDEAHERVLCHRTDSQVTLRMNVNLDEASGGNTVSVKSLAAPEKARSVFHKATEAFHKSRLTDAWHLVNKALTIAPRYAEALTLRGILRVDKNDLKGGEEDFQASLKNDPNYPLAYFAMGAALNVQGQYEDAQRTLEQGLKLDPVSWQGYFELSKAMLGKSDYRSALKYLVKTESLETNYAPIYLVKGHALLGLKFYDEAATAFERYLQMDPHGANVADAQQYLKSARAFTNVSEE